MRTLQAVRDGVVLMCEERECLFLVCRYFHIVIIWYICSIKLKEQTGKEKEYDEGNTRASVLWTQELLFRLDSRHI